MFLVWRRELLKLSRRLINWPPAPAAMIEKHAIVKRFGRDARIGNFIETGTYLGNMVEAQRENFGAIVTIELSDELYEAARKRFEAYPHIHVLHGDSGELLPEAFKLIHGPALFWLDAHYSSGVTARGNKETPILKELSIIAGRNEPGDIILIDDARLFNLHIGYPRLARIRDFVAKNWPGRSFRLESDFICITPK